MKGSCDFKRQNIASIWHRMWTLREWGFVVRLAWLQILSALHCCATAIHLSLSFLIYIMGIIIKLASWVSVSINWACGRLRVKRVKCSILTFKITISQDMQEIIVSAMQCSLIFWAKGDVNWPLGSLSQPLGSDPMFRGPDVGGASSANTQTPCSSLLLWFWVGSPEETSF